MKYILTLVCILPLFAPAQELFTYTEPASNMAAKSIGIRLNSLAGKDNAQTKRYSLNPEIMVGLSRKIMAHTNVYFSNNPGLKTGEKFRYNGSGIYMKYRLYSEDEVHSHFRIAAFAEAATSNILIEQPAISLNGSNTGYEIGIVATKLINKVAMSAGTALIKAYNNGNNKFSYGKAARKAFEYTVSLGKLMLPTEYTDYRQANLNLMVEMLGQYNPSLHAGYIDIAPSVQVILQSRMRIDAGCRFPLSEKLYRTTPRGFLFRFEYNLFNVYK